MTLMPTHHCFDDALEYVEWLVKERRELSRVFLVHGILLAPSGEEYSHAWVDMDGQAIEGAMLDGERVYVAYPREQFVLSRRVREVTFYTAHEAWQQNLKHGTFGPWEQKYKALCGSGARKFGGVKVEVAA